MNYTQNQKISQVTETTLIVGVDIGSETNFARVFNWRGQELSKKVFRFSNSLEGFQSFLTYLNTYMTIASAKQVIVGCEPTGHYWFSVAFRKEPANAFHRDFQPLLLIGFFFAHDGIDYIGRKPPLSADIPHSLCL